MSMIKDYPFTLANGARTQINGPIEFLRLMSTTGAIQLEVGNSVSELVAGRSVDFNEPVEGVAILNMSGAAVTGILSIGAGASIHDNILSGAVTVTSGNIAISNAPNIGTVAAITPETLVTGYFRASPSNALYTLVTPAANTAGITVHGAGCAIESGTPQSQRVMAKASAPTAWNDTTAFTLAVTSGWPNGQQKFPIFLPAGTGLYEQGSSAANPSMAFCNYEVH